MNEEIVESEDSSSPSSRPSNKSINDNSSLHSAREHRLVCLSRMTARKLNLHTDSTCESNVEQHERLHNTDRH